MVADSPLLPDRFSRWILTDDGFLPHRFTRTVVLLHPGALETGDPGVPFAASNANNEGLSDAQRLAIDAAMLAVLPPGSRCNFALYGGYSGPREQWGLERIGMFRIDGRLRYFVGEGALRECLFTATEESFGAFLQLSYLWAMDESWCINSAPDLDFTAVGCSDQLAERLLDDPVLDARDWPALRVGSLDERPARSISGAARLDQ